MAGTGGGQQQPEQQTVLGFPVRPAGDAEAVKAGRHYWYELAGEISGALADIDRAISGMQWSGDARRAFDAAWSQFSGHGTEATQHAQEMGDQLLKLGNQIEDAQHEWDLAMAAMAASTAIGIGLTFVTFGVSDAVAEGAAAAAVGTMEAVCTALDIALDAAVQALIAAIRVAVQLAVKFTLQFTINVVSQETANMVDGRGLGNVDLLQAAEFAGLSMVIPGAASRLTIGGRQVLSGIPGAVVTGAATDAAVQGLEGVTEGKPFSAGEVVLSGALAGAGAAGGRAVDARYGLPLRRQIFRARLSIPGARPVMPEEWGGGSFNKKGVGIRWMDPQKPSACGVRIDQGDPGSPHPSQRVDHVIVRSSGKVIGRDGRPITGRIADDPVNAHIPLSEYRAWRRWNQP